MRSTIAATTSPMVEASSRVDRELTRLFPARLIRRVLQKVEGQVEAALLERLTQKLDSSEYWTDAFDRFGLRLADFTDEQSPTR